MASNRANWRKAEFVRPFSDIEKHLVTGGSVWNFEYDQGSFEVTIRQLKLACYLHLKLLIAGRVPLRWIQPFCLQAVPRALALVARRRPHHRQLGQLWGLRANHRRRRHLDGGAQEGPARQLAPRHLPPPPWRLGARVCSRARPRPLNVRRSVPRTCASSAPRRALGEVRSPPMPWRRFIQTAPSEALPLGLKLRIDRS